jgi:hypothetical protein
MMRLGFIASAHAYAWIDAHRRTRPWLRIRPIARRAYEREFRRKFDSMYAALVTEEG